MLYQMRVSSIKGDMGSNSAGEQIFFIAIQICRLVDEIHTIKNQDIYKVFEVVLNNVK